VRRGEERCSSALFGKLWRSCEEGCINKKSNNAWRKESFRVKSGVAYVAWVKPTLGSVYFDVKWFPSENIFREVIFPENVFRRKHFTVFTARTENHFFFSYFNLIILTYKM
jgi:hypothetical protein